MKKLKRRLPGPVWIAICLFSNPLIASELTYYGDIKTVIDQRCAGCHNPGGIGPFSLNTYDQVYGLRNMIVNSVQEERMPPWPPAKNCNEFSNDTSLSDQEKSDLLTWIESGAAMGDPNDAPEPVKPDPEFDFNIALQLSEPFTPTKSPDHYRCFILDPKLDRDTYIRALDFVPTNRTIAHHAIGYYIEEKHREKAFKWDADEPGPGYDCMGSVIRSGVSSESIASWVPGRTAQKLPGGAGLLIKKGGLIIMQVHYNSLGQSNPEPDQATLYLRTENKVTRVARSILFMNPSWPAGRMKIPAGEQDVVHDYSMNARNFLRRYGRHLGLSSSDSFAVLSVGLHMHQLGSKGGMRINGGVDQCVIDVPNFQFSWQGIYNLQSELVLSGNDRLNLECHWDNTEENQPIVNGKRLAAKNTGWGPGTRDEMCIMRILFTKANE